MCIIIVVEGVRLSSVFVGCVLVSLVNDISLRLLRSGGMASLYHSVKCPRRRLVPDREEGRLRLAEDKAFKGNLAEMEGN